MDNTLTIEFWFNAQPPQTTNTSYMFVVYDLINIDEKLKFEI